MSSQGQRRYTDEGSGGCFYIGCALVIVFFCLLVITIPIGYLLITAAGARPSGLL
jgi:hypothetical protein